MLKFNRNSKLLFLCLYVTIFGNSKNHNIDKNVTEQTFTIVHGGIVRGDTSSKKIALVFTGDEYADGGQHVREVLKKYNIHGSFFFTGNFYRNQDYSKLIQELISDGHYLGAHSDRHLLYCSWENRDSLLVDKNIFLTDLEHNYIEMAKYGISKSEAQYFMPPYEWYNQKISNWTQEFGLQLINFSPGTRSNADYTIPKMGKQYIDNNKIYNSIIQYEEQNKNGMNGFILLSHIGTHPARVDKFYLLLEKLINELENKEYTFCRIDELLEKNK